MIRLKRVPGCIEPEKLLSPTHGQFHPITARNRTGITKSIVRGKDV